MRVEPFVGFGDKLSVKALLAPSRLVAGDEQDGLAPGIEGESDSPFAVRRGKTQLLHVRMTGAGQRIDARSAELRAELLEKPGQSENFQAHVFVQREKLRLELLAEVHLRV